MSINDLRGLARAQNSGHQLPPSVPPRIESMLPYQLQNRTQAEHVECRHRGSQVEAECFNEKIAAIVDSMQRVGQLHSSLSGLVEFTPRARHQPQANAIL